jgi:hypothetical protein
VRPVMWMDVGITLVGDEPIDSIRFNYWSSYSAFEAVISSDPDTSNREDGLGQASTMMTLPFVDEFTPGAAAPIDVQLDVEEIAALYTPAAMSFLEATIGFTDCLAGQRQPWVGEPDVEDPDVDPAYLAALGACATDVTIEGALVRLFNEDDAARPVADVADNYASDSAVAALLAIDSFTACLGDEGYGWLGQPGANPDPDHESNGSDYLGSLAACSGGSGIQAALDDLLT